MIIAIVEGSGFSNKVNNYIFNTSSTKFELTNTREEYEEVFWEYVFGTKYGMKIEHDAFQVYQLGLKNTHSFKEFIPYDALQGIQFFPYEYSKLQFILIEGQMEISIQKIYSTSGILQCEKTKKEEDIQIVQLEIIGLSHECINKRKTQDIINPEDGCYFSDTFQLKIYQESIGENSGMKKWVIILIVVLCVVGIVFIAIGCVIIQRYMKMKAKYQTLQITYEMATQRSDSVRENCEEDKGEFEMTKPTIIGLTSPME